MEIKHIGHTTVPTQSRNLHLNNVLHVPKASKNLISVNRLARDNNAFLEFHPSHFFHPNHFFIKEHVITMYLSSCIWFVVQATPGVVPGSYKHATKLSSKVTRFTHFYRVDRGER